MAIDRSMTELYLNYILTQHNSHQDLLGPAFSGRQSIYHFFFYLVQCTCRPMSDSLQFVNINMSKSVQIGRVWKINSAKNWHFYHHNVMNSSLTQSLLIIFWPYIILLLIVPFDNNKGLQYRSNIMVRWSNYRRRILQLNLHPPT